MASTYTDSNRLTKQGQGENSNTWGTILNTVLDLVDELSDGITEVNVSAGNVTLTTNDGSSDQARNRVLKITGQPGAARSVIIPDVEKYYFVRVAVSGSDTVTIRNVSGTGFTVSSGTGNVLALCDGTSTTSLFTAQGDMLLKSGNLSGIADTSVARGNLGITVLGATSVGGNNKLLGTNSTGVYTSVSARTPIIVSNGTIAINAATSAAAGIIEIATSAEVQAGTDATKAVVPSTIKGALGYSTFFESANQTITYGSFVSVAHSLGGAPRTASFELVCTSTEGGFLAGDRIFASPFTRDTAAASSNKGFTMWYNASAVGVSYGTDTYVLPTKNGTSQFNLTADNWALVLKAWI